MNSIIQMMAILASSNLAIVAGETRDGRTLVSVVAVSEIGLIPLTDWREVDIDLD